MTTSLDPVTPGLIADSLRVISMDAVQRANSGHPGMPMGMADVATVLWWRYLSFDPAEPRWPDRDRFVLSAGHGSMLLYALLYLSGTAGLELEDLKRFRQLGAKTAGHPEYGHCPGVETTTGPLGQGLANAVGMALAERMMAARYGSAAVDHWTYVIAGDGCLMEGISHEAASLAGHLQLGRLIVFFDDNQISIDGPTSLSCSDDHQSRFAAYGWHVAGIDGHDQAAIAAAIDAARADPRPSLIACRTIIGKGAPNKAGSEKVHGAPLGDAEVAATREALGWPWPPFEIPAEIHNAWRIVGRRGAEARQAWRERLAQMPPARRLELERVLMGDLPTTFREAVRRAKEELAQTRPTIATRKASEMALATLIPALPELVGGSADLTHSNLTVVKGQSTVTAKDYSGRYIHFGVREHGMAAAMNGMALHGGLVPYGGTFLVFADYCRPSIRLAALMGLRNIFVMTHDSIGLGEDGPTHQPVEHLASLRAIPNLHVFRPADAIETLECWELATSRRNGPSLLALSRQNLPAVRLDHRAGNLCSEGGYVLAEAQPTRDVTLLATGSEVHLALEAAQRLATRGIAAAVVSLPCIERFRAADSGYRTQVLGAAPRLSIEAGSTIAWSEFVQDPRGRIGLDEFGASGPAPELYRHFGLTTDTIVDRVHEILGLRDRAAAE